MEIEIEEIPRTKKNSQRIVIVRNRPIIIPSKEYKEYEKRCSKYMPTIEEKIDYSVNLKCVYYMPTKRRVDLNNLLEATTDMLVHYGVLEDDNRDIVASFDGSEVRYDKGRPRLEIEITKKEGYEKWKK